MGKKDLAKEENFFKDGLSSNFCLKEETEHIVQLQKQEVEEVFSK